MQKVESSVDREISVRFAPIFYQALGESPRSDYITNFDFDGDWRGDNNWENVDNKKFPLLAYVYYSVSETATHYFLHYAVFHPRDYKGGESKGRILSELIREGLKRGAKYDPTGLADEAGVAHENDLEGALVVVAKNGKDIERAQVVYVETLHHSNFSLYRSGEDLGGGYGLFKTEGQRVMLYVEPKGHGVEAYTGGEKQIANKNFVVYRFGGKAEDPDRFAGIAVEYQLVPIKTSLWTTAKTKDTSNKTYGAFFDYREITINVVEANGKTVASKIKVGKLGAAFLGDTGGTNMAKPPWGWFDKRRRNDPLGLWFFDPARVIKRDFQLDNSFSTAYLRPPFWAEK